eukprot:Tbor_TRINITY_DN3808_c0_g1::TRINITY_DN3808_c0_g1_i1::g.5695::m.5695
MSQLNTDQILMKLSMLQGRAQPDFKGYMVKPERGSTKQSVIDKKATEERKRIGGVFVPFYHGKNAKKLDIQFDACKRSTTMLPLGLSNCRNPNVAPSHHPSENHQDLNFNTDLGPNTEKSILNTVHCEEDEYITQPPTQNSQHGLNPSFSGSINVSELSKDRPTYMALRAANSLDRIIMLQDDRLNHPTYTNKSRIYHADSRWNTMSQLSPTSTAPSPSHMINLEKKKKHDKMLRSLSQKIVVPSKEWR